MLGALILLNSTEILAHAQGFLWNLPPGGVSVPTDRRNNLFYVGEPIVLRLASTGATRYEIRDYWGDLVEAGPIVGQFIAPAVRALGWYKVYLFRDQNVPPWGNVIGGTMFVIIRDHPGFPRIPPASTPIGTEDLSDNIMRGIVGSGPMRHRFFANDPNQATSSPRVTDIAAEKTYYTPYDPYRGRALLGAFPWGTSSPDGQYNLGIVTQIVQRFKNDIKYWEARNEPNYTDGVYSGRGGDFATVEFIPFANTIHAIDPSLKVIGPGNVEIIPSSHGLDFIGYFLATPGAVDAMDGLSFHPYNSFLGDLFMARKSMDALVNLLTQYGAQNKERWQTEQGFDSCINGIFTPRHQGRWTMLMLMVLEQYGVPKERNYLFYDRNGGFYDVPVWWVNSDGTLNPLACLLRVWSEEIYGTRFAQAYDLGSTGNKLYIGSLFTGPGADGNGRKVAIFQSAGSTDGQVRLQVSDPSVRVVTPFGDERDLIAVDGEVLLPVTELPTYVRFSGTLTPVPQNWGSNLALNASVTSTVMGSHPSDPGIINPTTKVTNGEFENWYYIKTHQTKVWVDGSESFPAWVEIDLGQPKLIDRVVVYAGVPHQWDGTLLDYDLQYQLDGQWVTLQSVFEPTRVVPYYTPICSTRVDSFFSDRWVFSHSFSPITARKLRLWVRDVTYGGGANLQVVQAGGQNGLHLINLREVEAYYSGTTDHPNQPPVASNDTAYSTPSGIEIHALENDSDPDGWPEPLRINSVTTPVHGSVSITTDGIRYQPNWGYSGPDSFTYTITDGLKTATATVNLSVDFPLPARVGGWRELKGEYFSGTNFNSLLATRYDSNIDFTVGPTWPGGNVDGQSFSVRWTGKIQLPYSGMFTFTSWSDDGIRVWIDNNLVIDNWSNHPPTRNTWTWYLWADQLHDVKIEYFQAGGGGEARFLWANALQPTEAMIPFTPAGLWLRSRFTTSQLANTTMTDPKATPANDGVPNFLKYAFNLAPLAPSSDSSALPKLGSESESGRNYLTLTYRKNSAATDLNYNVLATPSLAPDSPWMPVPAPEIVIGTDTSTGDPIIRRRVDVTGVGQRFIRLEVR